MYGREGLRVEYRLVLSLLIRLAEAMDQTRNVRLVALIAQTKALQRAMEHSVSEKNQEHARYESFGVFARTYNSLARQAAPFVEGSYV